MNQRAQVIVFADPNRVPFRLPDGMRWHPMGNYIHAGRTHPAICVSAPSLDAARKVAALAREQGLHGIIRPLERGRRLHRR